MLLTEIDAIDGQKEAKNNKQTYNEIEKDDRQKITMQHEQSLKEPSYSEEPMVSVWEESSDEEDLVRERKRAKDRDPLKDKLLRIFKPKTPKSLPMLDSTQPLLTPKPSSTSDDDERPTGVPVRSGSSTTSMTALTRRKAPDESRNPVGGDLEPSTETVEEQVGQSDIAQHEADPHAASDRRLQLAGRQHVADPKIGWAPPLTTHTFTGPRLRRSREPLNSETSPERNATTSIDADVRKALPTHDYPAHALSHAFMSYTNTDRPRKNSRDAGGESSSSSGSSTESLHGVNNIGISSGFPCALAKVDSGYHSVIAQCSMTSLKQLSSVSITSGAKPQSRRKRSEPDCTVQPVHPEQDDAPHERKPRPIPEDDKEEAIDSTTKTPIDEGIREHPLTPPKTPTSLPSFHGDQPQRTAAAEKPEASQTGATNTRADPISKEVDHPSDVALEKRQISLTLPTNLPSKTKPTLEIDTSVSGPVASDLLVCHDDVVVEKHGYLNVYKPRKTTDKPAPCRSTSGSVHAKQSIIPRSIQRVAGNGNQPIVPPVPLIDPKWQQRGNVPFPQATSPLTRTPFRFVSDALSTRIRHQAYEAAIVLLLKDEKIRLANNRKGKILPTRSVKGKTNRSAVSHVTRPPHRGQTSTVNSGNLLHFYAVLKSANVDPSESPALKKEPVQLSPAFPISAGHKKEILPAPRQLLDDTNALGIINLPDFPLPSNVREPRQKSPQLSQVISKQPSKDFLPGNTEQIKDLQASQPHRKIGSDETQTQILTVRNWPSISPSGQEHLPKQKEAAVVHPLILRAGFKSENPSSESQRFDLIPFVAERTRQRIARAEEKQASISSNITRGSPVPQIGGLDPSQGLSREPQQSSPSSPTFTFTPATGFGLAKLAINDSPYLDLNKVQSFVTEPPTPPTDYPSSPEAVSTRASIQLPVTTIVPASPSASSDPKYFLDNCLAASGAHSAEMDRLEVRKSQSISVRTKAVEDARQMQASVLEAAAKAGKDPPKYVLLELTGKGSFGRVYKAKDMTSAAIVAVKIIDIDESDTINPKNADSYSEFLKEISALKTLSESKARNINHVIEALPVGQAMWMITEYCGGGSVATLMKPTAPGGLQEKWIIPILREVAEAIKWVHDAGIIHRANVLVTEEGGVQLCDFGVAGTMETKVDKRSTIIGTPHWMAPELFDATPSYGKEVDIWAFGSMVYEIATGLPPNAANRIPFERLGPYLKQHVPRLEGGDYSDDLRSLVAYCLEEFPSERPTIDQVQMHPYIYNTQARYPTSSLSHLVRAFKLWEDHGGSRKSLFMIGGAQGPSELSSTAISDDEWNFSTTAAFDQEVRRQSTAQDVYDVYGSGVDFDAGFAEQTSKPPPAQKGRRRPPPEALAPLKAPLEKIFDPNTLSNYEENSRNHYGRIYPQPSSDLPLRDDSAQNSIRDTMIDLGGHDVETGMSSFPDMETIKAGRYGRDDPDDDYTSTLPDFSRPALSDPADINPNRRTQDWKFPSMAPPASADPELSRFPSSYEVPRPAFTPGSGGRPPLVHHPTEPLGSGFGGSFAGTQPAMERMSVRESLIDLDMSLPDPVPEFAVPEFARPSTAQSDTISISSERTHSLTSSTVNPFELEHHASLYQPSHEREPSIYITEDFVAPSRRLTGNTLNDLADVSDFSVSDAEGNKDEASDSDYAMPSYPTHIPDQNEPEPQYTMAHFPDLPPAPSIPALTGEASHAEMQHEMTRMLASLTGQLSAFRDVYDSPAVARRPSRRRQPRADGENGV
ncbi:serine threonine- kinase nak1 protein [Rutstroemia sp. NJR-2017a BBW]|nr:serine threonine- kinase nak1 protein [Rutstroemia sp. NJR-2017a BBW]PQE08590.1 serine threonine- kinase nak1 protein [Rutstroemia sp. NJR-2017a BBW]